MEWAFYLYQVAVLGLALYELKNLRTTWGLLRKIKETPEVQVDGLLALPPNTSVEFKGLALKSSETSPISQSPCAHWKFEVTRLVIHDSGQTQSYNSLETKKSRDWIFFKVGSQLLPVSVNGMDGIHMSAFSWQSIIGTEPPLALQVYMGSASYMKAVGEYSEYQKFIPFAGSSFTETIVPTNIPIYVHGTLRELDSAVLSELEYFAYSDGHRLPVCKYTIGGDNLSMSLSDERHLLKNVRGKLLLHIAVILLAIGIGTALFFDRFNW